MNKTVTWLTIALFTPLAVLSFSGQVLCVGQDNHSQVESIIESCCDLDVSASEAAELVDDFGEHPGCGDCNDVDLDQVMYIRSLSRSADVQKMIVFIGLVSPAIVTPPTNCTGKEAHQNEYSPAITQTQLSVSTTILIC